MAVSWLDRSTTAQNFFSYSRIEQARGMGASPTMTSMRRAHSSHILLIGIIGVAGELVEDVQPVSIPLLCNVDEVLLIAYKRSWLSYAFGYVDLRVAAAVEH